MEEFLDGRVVLHAGDCRDVLCGLADCSIDSVVTDPPYALVSIQKRFGKAGSAPAKDAYARGAAGFMGKQWDTGETAFAVEFWAEVYRVLKPGGHVVAFSGTRTYHRMTCAIEDAGFEIRDMLGWLYGSGFPKSHDVSKAVDKKLGAKRDKIRHKPRAETSGTMSGSSDTRPWIEASRSRGYHEVDGAEAATPEAAAWQGWGTALKPAQEPICLARKPLNGTVAENVMEHGTGALNIDGCRVGDDVRVNMPGSTKDRIAMGGGWRDDAQPTTSTGRWPANIIHDGSDDASMAFGPSDDGGSTSRFFYTAKAGGDDRLGAKHPTVKPLDLMQYLCRLITPPGGVVLDPFAGTGSTGEAAWREGFSCILVEREEEYQGYIRKRMEIAPQHSSARKLAAAKPAERESYIANLFESEGN